MPGAPPARAGLHRQAFYLGPVLIWMALIALLSTDMGSAARTSDPLLVLLYRLLRPGATLAPALVESLSEVTRKSAHVCEYGMLGLLLCRWLRAALPGSVWRLALLAVVLATSYAGLDELHQALVPSRTGALRDVGFDLLGAALGCVLYAWRRGLSRRRE